MEEQKIERRLKKEIELIGGKALKFVSPGTSGVPDRIILLPYGKVIFAELKAPGKKLRPIQELRKKELEKLGFDYWIVDSYEEIESLLNYIKVKSIKGVV